MHAVNKLNELCSDSGAVLMTHVLKDGFDEYLELPPKLVKFECKFS